MRLARRPEGSDAPQECQRWRLSLKSKGNKYKAARPERQGACYRMKYNEHRGSHVRTYLRNVHTYVRMYVVKTEASRCKHYMRTCCFLHVFNTLQPFQWSLGMTSLLKEHFPDSLPSPASEGECVITADIRTHRQTVQYVHTYACTTLCSCGHQLICPSSHQMHCCWHCLTLTCKTSFSTTALRRTHFSFSKQSSSACTLLYATYSTYIHT